MRICDLPEEKIVVGLKMRSLINPDVIGTVVKIDYHDDRWAWVKWSHRDWLGGFYGNNCRCEVIEEL